MIHTWRRLHPFCRRGYACCHSAVKQSYCVGAAGRDASAGAAEQLAINVEQKAAEEAERRANSKLVGHKPAADVWGEAAEEQQLDAAKVAEALRRQEEVRLSGWVVCARVGGWCARVVGVTGA